MVEDDLDRALRNLREKRAQYIEALALGSVSPDNVPDGYMQTSGKILALDDAIDIVKDAFSGWLPPEPKPKPARPPGDY